MQFCLCLIQIFLPYCDFIAILDIKGKYLAHCLLNNQIIVTHYTIKNMMFANAHESEYNV